MNRAIKPSEGHKQGEGACESASLPLIRAPRTKRLLMQRQRGFADL